MNNFLMASSLRLLLGENLPKCLLNELRTEGYRATSIEEVGLKGAPDTTIAAYVRKEGYVYVVNGNNDSISQKREYSAPPHSGIIEIRIVRPNKGRVEHFMQEMLLEFLGQERANKYLTNQGVLITDKGFQSFEGRRIKFRKKAHSNWDDVPRFLLDQHLSKSILDVLKSKGYNAVSVQEVDFTGEDDRAIALYAHRKGYIIISKDVGWSTRPEHSAFPHPGIIVLRVTGKEGQDQKSVEDLMKERLLKFLDLEGKAVSKYLTNRVVEVPLEGRATSVATKPGTQFPPTTISRKMVLLALLAILIILGSGAALHAYSAHQTDIYNANATAITQANNTATAQAAQATDQAGTVTAQAIQATDQAAAQAQANAQATNDAQGTAQAQANAGATTTAVAYNPYPPNTGTLVINDSLSDNSQGYQWDESSTCVFTNGAYQVSTSANVLSTCTAQATNFTSNFAYQVDITIIQGCGGITFFSQGDNFNYTIFEICQDGSINISVCEGNSVSHDCSSGGTISPNFPIQTGSGQSNTLAVVDANNSLSFYVNQQPLQTAGPGVVNVTGGKMGVLADIRGTESSGQATCSNVKVWTL